MSTTLPLAAPTPHGNLILFQICSTSLGQESREKRSSSQWSQFPTLTETPSLPISETQDQLEILLLTALTAQNLQVYFTLSHNIHWCLLPLPSF